MLARIALAGTCVVALAAPAFVPGPAPAPGEVPPERAAPKVSVASTSRYGVRTPDAADALGPVSNAHLDRVGQVYCESNPNSTGAPTEIELIGSEAAADDALTLRAYAMPRDSIGHFIVSARRGFVANPDGSDGNLCILGPIGRLNAPGQVKSSGDTGVITLSTIDGEWSLTELPTPTGTRGALTGTTDNFQLWHRDVVGGEPTSQFSNGVTHTWL